MTTILKAKSFQASNLEELENKVNIFIKNITNYNDFQWQYNKDNKMYEAFITYWGKDEE